MLRWMIWTVVIGFGCAANGPNLPGYNGVPIEAPAGDYEPCATDREVDVRCVYDGDTVSLSRCDTAGERIRLLGIDAPELAHEGQEAECYGDAATDALDQMIGNEAIWLSFGPECLDIYGRTLAWVWVAEEDELTLVNEWMLRHGHARLYEGVGSENLVYEQRLEAAEQSAMEGQLGLWGECGG